MPSRKRFGRHAVLLLAACLTLTACDLFSKTHYDVAGAGKDKQLAKDLKGVVSEQADAIKIPKNKDDAARQEQYQEQLIKANLQKQLAADGYYDGKVEFKRGTKDWSGKFRVDPGFIYRIASVTVTPEPYAHFLAGTGLKAGQSLDAAKVLKAQAALNTAIGKDGCYFTLSVENAVVLDKTAKTGAITFKVTAGPHAHFADVTFVGNGDVDLRYLYNTIPWKNGGCFDRGKIEAFRTALLGSGLFSGVDADLPKMPEADGAVPITFKLKTRVVHTVNAGLNYYTSEGFGATFGWSHRNIFGNGELLQTQLTLSQLIQNITTTLTKPYFLRKDQTLTVTDSLDHEDTDAYRKAAIDNGASVSRTLTPHLTVSTGIDYLLEHLDDKSTLQNNDYGLVSFPQTVTLDERDNTLNPMKGYWLSGLVKPYVDTFGQSAPFLKLQGEARTYIPATDWLTLALRAKVGSILGQGTVNLPASELFFSGGGGSVRGFGYQDIGPFQNGQPTGGRALVEGSSELRFKINDQFGFVTFLDAGSVNEGVVPDFSQLSLGTGVGIRYFTSFGPLRADIGVPLNHRQNAGGNYQLYISIGQAF